MRCIGIFMLLSLIPSFLKCEPLYLEAGKYKNCIKGFKVCSEKMCGGHLNEKQPYVKEGDEFCMYVPSVAKCYWLQVDSLRVHKANETCRKKSMSLPDIRTEDEDIKISESFRKYNKIESVLTHWLAIRYEEDGTCPRRTSDGSLLKEDDWRGSEDSPVDILGVGNLPLKGKKGKPCVCRDMHSGWWRQQSCTSQCHAMCEGRTDAIPSKPSIESEKLKLKNLVLTSGEVFDVICSAELHASGNLSILIIFPTRTEHIQDGDSRIHCEEEVSTTPGTEECERRAKCSANIPAVTSFNGGHIGCKSLTVEGAESCSPSDTFCSVLGPIKVVDSGQDGPTMLLAGIAGLLVLVALLLLICYYCCIKRKAAEVDRSDSSDSGSAQTSRSGDSTEMSQYRGSSPQSTHSRSATVESRRSSNASSTESEFS